MAEVWTISRALQWTRGYLEEKGSRQPLLDAQWLLSHASGYTRLELYMHADKPLNRDELAVLHQDVVKRASGEPLQYITGVTGFRMIDVLVEPGVLIPRPETEVLVDVALKVLDACEQDEPLAADVCCGSGCIACSIASERRNVHVLASDISEDALRVSLRNVEALGLGDRVELYQGDLLAALPEEAKGSIACIVSNPPYVPSDVVDSLEDEVKAHEPRLALDGGADGLDAFRRLAAQAGDWLSPGGTLVCELHETTLEYACAIARECGAIETAVINDLAGKPRILRASFN